MFKKDYPFILIMMVLLAIALISEITAINISDGKINNAPSTNSKSNDSEKNYQNMNDLQKYNSYLELYDRFYWRAKLTSNYTEAQTDLDRANVVLDHAETIILISQQIKEKDKYQASIYNRRTAIKELLDKLDEKAKPIFQI